MARNAFVEPATVRLELSEGDWIEVKREITYGEQLELQDESSPRSPVDNKTHFVYSNFQVARMAICIVEWSFEDDNGQVEVTRDAIRALKRDIAEEFSDALDKYEAEQIASKNAVTPG